MDGVTIQHIIIVITKLGHLLIAISNTTNNLKRVSRILNG